MIITIRNLYIIHMIEYVSSENLLTFVQFFVMFIIDELKNLLNLIGYLYGKN